MSKQKDSNEDFIIKDEDLSSLLMDSLPHPAMIIKKDQTILMANKIARERGAIIGDFCWKSFAKGCYISKEHKECINIPGVSFKGIKCTFCLVEESFRINKFTRRVVQAFDKEWDTWWIPLDEDKYLHYGIDITERKLAEETLRKSQAQVYLLDRLARIGTLAAGVAHEINNPMQEILINLVMLERSSSVKELKELLPYMRTSVQRVVEIVKSLSQFAHSEAENSNNKKCLVNVWKKVEEAKTMAEMSYKDVAWQINVVPELPEIFADPLKLGQVFLNLFVNAIQAEAKHILINANYQNGNIIVWVEDNGSGIPEEKLSKIFDPFFTTKEIGAGSGLGLSLCHGIITDLGGHIEVSSTVGVGTIFTLYLPTILGDLNENYHR